MKSIKEKAEEWADMYPSCGMADKSFTEGANYVLECFESILPFVAKKGIIYGKIKEIIEQLKSNQ